MKELISFPHSGREIFECWYDVFSGYLIEGSNGEYVLLSPEERVELVARARALIPKDKLLLAGAGAESEL